MSARLFYLPAHSSDIAAMRDLQGNVYGEMRNAFSYRKKLRDGCSCRPMPWSAAERARHRRYEVYEDYLKIQRKRDAEQRRIVAARNAKLAEQRLLSSGASSQQVIEQTALKNGGSGVAPGPTWVGGAETAGSSPTWQEPQSIPTAYKPPVSSASAKKAKKAKQAKRARTKRITSRHHASTKRAKARKNKSSPPMGLGGFFGGGGGGSQKYSWPGDR